MPCLVPANVLCLALAAVLMVTTTVTAADCVTDGSVGVISTACNASTSCGLCVFAPTCGPMTCVANMTAAPHSRWVVRVERTGELTTLRLDPKLMVPKHVESLEIDGGDQLVLELTNGAFGGMGDLKNLTLTHLTVVDWSVVPLQRLMSLRSLTISRTNLGSLAGLVTASSFGSTTSPMLSLDLSGNSLLTLPRELHAIERLASLDLRDNNIKGLELSTEQLQFLNRLSVLHLDATALQVTNCDGDRTLLAPTHVEVCVQSAKSGGLQPASTPQTKASTSSIAGLTPWSVVAAVFGGALATAVCVFMCFMYRSRRQAQRRREWCIAQANHSDAYEQMVDPANVELEVYPSEVSPTVHAHWEALELELWRRRSMFVQTLRQLKSTDTVSSATRTMWLGVYRHQKVALKRLPVGRDDALAVCQFLDEIKLNSELTHSKIVRFRGVAWTKPSGLQMLLEYMDRGDLRSYLTAAKPTTALDAGHWCGSRTLDMAIDIADALAYLHSLEPPLAHGALSSHKVLLNHEYAAKLSDFSSATRVATLESDAADNMLSSQTHARAQHTQRPRVGTAASMERFGSTRAGRWVAPEVLSGTCAAASVAADMYSFGIILSELDTFEWPFAQAPPGMESALLTRIVQGSVRPTLSEHCPGIVRELICQCLSPVPEERPCALDATFQLRTLAQRVHRAATLSDSSVVKPERDPLW